MIYCVEDDRAIRELLVYTLASAGYEARGFERAEEMLACALETLPRLVLLDVMLPGMDGVAALRRLRNEPRTAEVSVILVTAKGEEYDKVIGLDSGADDYVAKPFGMLELLARVRTCLRRASPDKPLRAGSLSLDVKRREVTADGTPVVLTRKEFDVLRLLLEADGEVLDRDTLLARVWGYDFDGETRTVDVHVRTLRQKLGEAGDAIETVRGVGYRVARREREARS